MDVLFTLLIGLVAAALNVGGVAAIAHHLRAPSRPVLAVGIALVLLALCLVYVYSWTAAHVYERITP